MLHRGKWRSRDEGPKFYLLVRLQVIDAGTCDETGIYQRGIDTKHGGRSVHVFGNPYTYIKPICSTLICLMCGGIALKLRMTFTRAAIVSRAGFVPRRTPEGLAVGARFFSRPRIWKT